MNGHATFHMDELDHPSRARLLTATLSPARWCWSPPPTNTDSYNLAPMTSLSVVSNSPPLVVMSLSSDRDGRARDTLLNLRECPNATLYVLLSGPDDADMVAQTAPAVPRARPDGTLYHVTIPRVDPSSIEAAAALQVRMVDEFPLPDAVAKLVVLRVDDVMLPEASTNAAALDVLCQHGLDRLMASPTGWSQADRSPLVLKGAPRALAIFERRAGFPAETLLDRVHLGPAATRIPGGPADPR